MAMRRGDRRDDSYDNSLNYPQSHQQEPLSYHELKSKVITLRADKTDLEQKVQTIQVQYETVLAERDQYITLYNEAQDQLKFERRSKAGIKGWETRRKRENEKLKQEIAEMMVLMRDSLAREETAISNLEEMATRMDRIQHLVDSVEDDTTDGNPISLLQKFRRIWQAVQDILAE